MKIKILKLVNVVLLLAGFYLIYLICAKIGWQVILDRVLSIQVWQAAVILVFPISWHLLHSWGWSLAFHKRKDFKFRHLLSAQIATNGIAEVIPLGQAGGESYRVFYLKRKYIHHQSPNIFASVVIYNTIHTLATGLLMALGFLIMISMIDISLSKKIVLASLLLIGVITAAFLIERQRKGFMVKVFLFLNHFKMFQHFVETKMEKAKEVDKRLNQFYGENKKHFYLSFFIIFFAKLSGGIEFYLILSFIGDPAPILVAFFIFAGKALFQMLLFFFPAQIGASEGSIYYLFSVLGMNTASGMALALFVRIRTVIWTIIGLIIGYFYGPNFFKGKKKLFE